MKLMKTNISMPKMSDTKEYEYGAMLHRHYNKDTWYKAVTSKKNLAK
jgi:hypothetical protein